MTAGKPTETVTPSDPACAASGAVLLAWTTQPARSRPVVAALVVLLMATIVTIVFSIMESAFFALISALILWGSLSQFYLKTHFELTENLVRIKYLVNKVEKPWAQFRSFYPDKNGVLLSPFVRPSRLENFRGLYLRFAGNREQVLEVIRSKIRQIEDPV